MLMNPAKLQDNTYYSDVAWPTTLLWNMCLEIQVSENIMSVHSVQVKHCRQMVTYTVYSDTTLQQVFSVSIGPAVPDVLIV